MSHHISARRGFTCPRCRKPLPTEAVQRAAPGVRLRARLCPRCGLAELTRERAVRGQHLLAARPGFYCGSHPALAMHTTDVRRVGPGIVVRYIQCPACRPGGYVCRRGPRRPGVPQVRTEERAARAAGCTTPLEILSAACEGG